MVAKITTNNSPARIRPGILAIAALIFIISYGHHRQGNKTGLRDINRAPGSRISPYYWGKYFWAARRLLANSPSK